jgi:hypothetical protein
MILGHDDVIYCDIVGQFIIRQAIFESHTHLNGRIADVGAHVLRRCAQLSAATN